jgi:hypothetical protein
MNDISNARSPRAASRIVRGVGVAALSTVLVAGLAGCMTGKPADSGPALERNAVAPAGVDVQRPADRIVEELERQVSVGSWTDRVAAENAYAGMTADRIERLLPTAK